LFLFKFLSVSNFRFYIKLTKPKIYYKLDLSRLSRILSSEEAFRRTVNILEHPLAQWLEFSSETVISAIKLSKESRIKINDALIAQQALAMKAAVLTDNIKDFENVKGLKIIPLR
jgi:predicted nucleic acid-binding protein